LREAADILLADPAAAYWINNTQQHAYSMANMVTGKPTRSVGSWTLPGYYLSRPRVTNHRWLNCHPTSISIITGRTLFVTPH